MSALEILEENFHGDERNLFRIAIVACKLLGIVVDDASDMHRALCGELRLNTQTFALRDVARVAEEVYSEHARKKGLFLNIDVAFHIRNRLVVGDRRRLESVLLALVANALKHTHEGGVTLTVEESMSDTIEFNVTDTGIGIAPHLLLHLFELREEGVGLWLSQKMVRLMGGEIRTKSVLAVGSVLYFSL